jgi:hypothetical protein
MFTSDVNEFEVVFIADNLFTFVETKTKLKHEVFTVISRCSLRRL